MLSSNSGSSSHSKIQPKFKDCQFDSAKNPAGLLTWMMLISNLVRNISGGMGIEHFLDWYLKRNVKSQAIKPAFLDNEALRLPEDESFFNVFATDPNYGQLSSPPSAAVSGNGTAADSEATLSEAVSDDAATKEGTPKQPAPVQGPKVSAELFPRKYTDLSSESRDLDIMLYTVLVTVITGPMLDIIQGLQGVNARYTFAIIAMWEHAQLGASTRRLKAMETMNNLSFNGDAAKWKIDFLKAAREIYESGVTIEHFMMQAALKSFDGKNREAQTMIVKDINEEGLIGPGVNLEELAAKYATFVSTMNAGKTGGPIHAVTKKKHCKGGCEGCLANPAWYAMRFPEIRNRKGTDGCC